MGMAGAGRSLASESGGAREAASGKEKKYYVRLAGIAVKVTRAHRHGLMLLLVCHLPAWRDIVMTAGRM